MAQQTSNKSTEPTDKNAITAGENAMLGVTQNLFSVLDELGQQQSAGMTAENEALTNLLTAESALSTATTMFAGPSPRFDAPTWEGSPANPKRASYEKEFTPIITKVLTAPTVQSDELAISAQLTEEAIKSAFNTQATTKGLVYTKDTPLPDSVISNDTAAMQWIAESIISLSGTIPEEVQQNLADLMIAQVNAMTVSTLYHNLQQPNYWVNIPDIEVSGGSTTGPLENAVGQIQDFIAEMWSTYGSKTSLSESIINTAIADSVKATITDPDAQKVLKLLTNSEQQYFKSLITTAANQAKAALPEQNTLPKKSVQNYTIILDALNSLAKNTNPYIKAFPTAAATSSATWDGDFWAIVQQAVVGSPASEAAATDAKLKKVLNALESSYKTLPRNPLNPDEPISDEAEINAWIESTVTNLITSKTLTQTQGQSLNSGLIDEVMQLFPIPDKISFYDTFKDNLTDSLLNLPGIQKNTSQQASGSQAQTNSSKGKSNSTQTSAQTKATPDLTTDGQGLRHAIDSNTSSSNLVKIANEVLLNLKPGQKNPIAESIVHSKSASDISAITNALNTSLTNEVENIVQQAIDNVFISLSEQGVQGQMISTSYDYQLINRITSYTSTLLNQLDKHYDVDVPANSAESITAAQSITSASVSYRNYEQDLKSLNNVFQDAEKTSNPNSGRDTKELNLYFNGNPSGKLEWQESLTNVSDAIYGSNSNKEALILESEYDAVQLAANAAGFASNLNDEFLQERTSTEEALNSLLSNTKQLFTTTQTSYDQLSNEYFEALATYTESKESYEIDEAVNLAYDSALAGLTSILETGNVGYAEASIKTLPSNS